MILLIVLIDVERNIKSYFFLYHKLDIDLLCGIYKEMLHMPQISNFIKDIKRSFCAFGNAVDKHDQCFKSIQTCAFGTSGLD